MEPFEKKQIYRNQLMELLKGKPQYQTKGVSNVVSGAREDEDVLCELANVLPGKEIEFTKVSDMKIDEGREKFPTHERCDFLAREARKALTESLGLLRETDSSRMGWPYAVYAKRNKSQ
jgi:hypothetical protein